MKIKLSLKKLAGTALWLTLLTVLFSPETSAQGTVTLSRPGNSLDYDFINAVWVHKSNSTYTYNVNGQLTSLIRKDAVTNQNLNKWENTYDQFVNLASSTIAEWQNNAWVITGGSNNIRTYNASNQVTGYILQSWQNGAWTNIKKDTYSYNPAGQLVEEITAQWQNNSWENSERHSYTYVNGTRTERRTDIFQPATGTWLPIANSLYAGWQVSLDKPTTATQQIKDANGNWKSIQRSVITLGPFGSYQEVNEVFQTGAWVFSERTSYTYDSQLNLTDYLFEEFMNGTWRMLWNNKAIYIYNAQNDLLQEIIQGQDTTAGPVLNKVKHVFSNFQYFNPALGQQEEFPKALSVSLFPNPAQDILNIGINQNTRLPLKATITDLAGKPLQNQNFEPKARKEIRIENLKPGVYLLQLETAKGKSVQKFVKQ